MDQPCGARAALYLAACGPVSLALPSRCQPPPPIVTFKNTSLEVECFPKGQNHPLLRTTGLRGYLGSSSTISEHKTLPLSMGKTETSPSELHLRDLALPWMTERCSLRWVPEPPREQAGRRLAGPARRGTLPPGGPAWIPSVLRRSPTPREQPALSTRVVYSSVSAQGSPLLEAGLSSSSKRWLEDK